MKERTVTFSITLLKRLDSGEEEKTEVKGHPIGLGSISLMEMGSAIEAEQFLNRILGIRVHINLEYNYDVREEDAPTPL
jgi:hypothetical protein